MITLHTPAIDAVRKSRKGATEHVVIFDSLDEFYTQAKSLLDKNLITDRPAAAWTGHISTADAVHMIASGDPSAVAASDKLLDSLEQYLHIASSRFKMVDDVAGAMPNVPAYLAGQPLSMRRRQRTSDEQAPLTVVLDVTSSASITADQLKKRGAAILAFVRAMITRRPVKLFVAVTTGNRKINNGKDAQRLLIPVETSPIDLVRAAYLLTHTGLPRALGYPMAFRLAGDTAYSGDVPWPYCDAELSRSTEQATYEALLQGGEVFSIAAPHTKDPHLNNPEGWLKFALAKFGISQELAA